VFKFSFFLIVFTLFLNVGFLLDRVIAMFIGTLFASISDGVGKLFTKDKLHLTLRKIKRPDKLVAACTDNYLKKVEIKGFSLLAGNSFFVERENLCNRRLC